MKSCSTSSCAASLLLTTSSRRWKLPLSRRSRGSGDKGNFCRSKTREGQQGVGRYFCQAKPGAEMWRHRHLGVKVEVSIRQRRFVGLIGHPHVFVPIMGLRAEGPAGLRAGKPGGPAVTGLPCCSVCALNCAALHALHWAGCASMSTTLSLTLWTWLSFLQPETVSYEATKSLDGIVVLSINSGF